MTIVVAWLRKVGKVRDYHELVVASDSRLRGGEAWDAAPKIFPLSRGDSVVAFAGQTFDAYPLLIQLHASIEHYPKARDRAQDFHGMRTHALNLLNFMWQQKTDLPTGVKTPDPPDARFLLAGFSWQAKRFALGYIAFEYNSQRFNWNPVSNDYVVLGHPLELEAEFRSQLRLVLSKKLNPQEGPKNRRLRRSTRGTQGWDMEPLQLLARFCQSAPTASVGGPPQVAKIYEHMNCMPYAVFWPSRASGRMALFGRPMLPYERTNYLAIDPWTGKTHKTWDYRPLTDSRAAVMTELCEALSAVIQTRKSSQPTSLPAQSSLTSTNEGTTRPDNEATPSTSS